MKKFIHKKNLIIFIIILASILMSSLFLVDKIVYNGIDTTYHLSRIIGIVNSWKSGNILAYIHLDDTGYGYGMGFFYSNLFMILPCLIYLSGASIFTAYKILIFSCSIFTALSMYISTKKITKSKYASTISTLLYTTCGYRIITMVVKSFIGELLSFIFIPIIILGLYELIFDDKKRWWIFSLGFIGILNSNLVMTEIMIAISGIILLCNVKEIIKDKLRFYGVLKAIILTLLVCAAFWMPMIEQLNTNTFKMKSMMSIYQPRRWLLDFTSMFWGIIQYKNHNVAPAYSLGIIFVIILIFRTKIKEKNITIKFCDISILTGLILLICMTNFFPWKYLTTLGGMLQFPSRLEIPTVAFFAIACGIVCQYLANKKEKFKNWILIGIIIWQFVFCLISLYSCIQVLIKENNVENKEEIAISNDFQYDICDGVYLPNEANYLQANFKNKENEENSSETQYLNNSAIYDYKKNGLSIELTFENTNTDYIDVPMYYYYGYVAESIKDGYEYLVSKGDDGVVRIYLGDRKSDTIHIYYKTTMVQKIGVSVSGITIIYIVVYIIKKYYIRKLTIKNQKDIVNSNK